MATRSWQTEVVKVRSYRRSVIHTSGALVRKRGDAGGQEEEDTGPCRWGWSGSPMRGSPVRKRGDAEMQRWSEGKKTLGHAIGGGVGHL